MTTAAASLLFISLGAFFMPLIARRLRVPSAVAELLYGMMLGLYFTRIASDEFISFMAQLGFVILMFSAGMEIDFAPLRKGRSRLFGAAWVWVMMTLLLAVLGAMALSVGPWPALAVCSVSIGLASVLLRERKLLSSPVGQAILAAGLIGETITILVLVMFNFWTSHGFTIEFYQVIAKFGGIFVLAYFMMRLLRFLIWWRPRRVKGFLESGDPLELGLRMALALLFVFVAAAALLEVEAILGAFIAGALFGFIFQEREVIAEKINALGQGFFVPIFFIVVGSRFDPRAALELVSVQYLVSLLGLALAVKLIPSLVFRQVGLGYREILASGLLLAAPLSLTVAVTEIGVNLGQVSRDEQGALIMVAIIAGLLFPLLARLLLPGPETAQKPNNTRTG